MSQSILTNTAIAVIGKVANIVLGLFVIATITRLLGPSRYGIYALLISLGTIIQLLADLGLYLTVSREISQKPNDVSDILSHGISLRLFVLVLVFSLGAIFVFFTPVLQGLFLAFLLVAVGLIFQSISQIFMGVFQNYQIVWRASVGDVLGRFAQIGLIVLFSIGQTTVLMIIAAFTFGTAISWLFHYWLLPRKVFWRLSYSKKTWFKLLKSSWPLGVMLVLNAIYFRIDTLVLFLFRPAHEVGWYSLSYRIIESGLFFPAMFGGLLLPRISKALAEKKDYHVRKYLEEGLKILLLTASFTVVVLMSSSEKIIRFVSGGEFNQAAPLLQILSIALFVMFIGNLFGFTLVAMSKQMILLKLYASLALVNLIANIILIPIFGVWAAAWTTVVTEAVSMLVAAVVIRKVFTFSLSRVFLLKVLTSSLATVLFLYSSSSSFSIITLIFLALTLYISLNVILKTVPLRQLKLLTTKIII